MENSDSIRNQIYNTMQLKTTDELVFILEENDHDEWTETAFEIVKKILIERTGSLPELPIKTLKPSQWETIDWKAVSEKCSKMFKKTSLLISISFAVLLLILIFYIFFSSQSIVGKLTNFGIGFALLAALFAANIWQPLSLQNKTRIVAIARVYLKNPRSRNRGSLHDVGFAIKTAFTLHPDGELVVNENWNGHHTLSVPAEDYIKLDEQDIVNIIFLSNNQFLGLLEDFDEKQPPSIV